MFTLYRFSDRLNTSLQNMPIKENDCSVNRTTDDDSTDKVTMVTLRLMISDNVLKRVPHIFCKIFRYSSTEEVVSYSTPSVFIELKSTPTTVPSVHLEIQLRKKHQ